VGIWRQVASDGRARRKIRAEEGGSDNRPAVSVGHRSGCPGCRYRNTDARRDAFGQATARLQQASGAAVSTILKIMLDKDNPAASRLRAAESVVDHAAKAIEIEEIEARVTALEEAAQKSGQR
jgi:hypothetical protein